MTSIHASGGGAPDRRHRLKSIIGGSTGNLVEWYDWYVYSAFTLYFGNCSPGWLRGVAATAGI